MEQQSVIIVGAGCKGLYAARCLTSMGIRVTVLERSDRIGGKLHTIRSKCGTTLTEMGAMRIPDNHILTLNLLKELGLEVESFIEDNDRCPFLIGSIRGTISSLNLGTLVAAGLIERKTLDATGLPPTTKFHKLLLEAFADSKLEDYEKSVHSFLSTPGPGSSLRHCAKVVLDLRNGVGGMHHHVKVAEFLNILKLHSGLPLHVTCGFDQIAQSLHDSLPPETVRINCNVTRVADMSDKVVVEFQEDGLHKKMLSDAVLFACPALHMVAMEPPLPKSNQDAIQHLRGNCNPAMKGVLLFSRRFWEEEQHGGVVGGTSWIGPSAVNQLYHPMPTKSRKG